MDLDKQQSVVASFRSWFSGSGSSQGSAISVKRTIEQNRARYRMLLSDAAERLELGLSALPSTKSCSIVDNAVVDAIQEYYQTDAITFTAEDSGDVNNDHLALWLSELFKYRAKKNSFWVWHLQSMKAGFVDGIEAALVRWRKEAYRYADDHYYSNLTGQEISREEYRAAKKAYPITVEGPFDPSKGRPAKIKVQFNEHYRAERSKKERVVADTWECVQLKPGENLLWDFKNPLLDLNRGQWAMVMLDMQAGEIMNLSKTGIFNKITEEELKPYLVANARAAERSDYIDTTSSATDPDMVDMGEYNTASVWVFFEKRDCQWWCTFSLNGELELMKESNVNSVFFNDRPFDRLPVVMGASDIELWEAIGRGIPKLIAPIEDEMTDHRNNVNDMAKQAATGKYRINEDSDVDLNSLLNDKFFYAKPGEVEKLDFSGEMAVVMRASDMVSSDIAALAPVSMADNSLVGRGNAKDTLGSVQLAMGGNDKKLNARLLVRNITFMEPLLRIVVEMTMAFETSQKIGRIAAKKAKIDMNTLTDVVDGKPVIDFSKLDFDAEIQINAGMGTVPKQMKATKLLQYETWATAKGLPVDLEEIDKQLKVLNGFNEDQFVLPVEKQKPKQQPVEDKLNITVTFAELLAYQPEAAQALLQKAVAGAMQVTTNVKEDKKPSYLKEPEGSSSHPVMQSHMTQESPQSEMEMQ